MSLTIPADILPRNERYGSASNYILTLKKTGDHPLISETERTLVLSAENMELIYDYGTFTHSTALTRVYRVRVSTGGAALDLACKFGYSTEKLAALRNEAGHYLGNLKELQGKHVPVFFGLYEGKGGFQETLDLACLITIYSGEPVTSYNEELSPQVVQNIADAYQAIHRAGIWTNNYHEYNSLMDDNGKITVIDFDDASLHDCHATYRPVYNAPRPPIEDLGKCPELHRLCDFFEVWLPSFIVVNRHFIDLPITVEEIVDLAEGWKGYPLSGEEARAQGKAALDKIRDDWIRRGCEVPEKWWQYESQAED
ncbi:hypothetical protein CERSUDRAFT_95090 [Gelatoporia subvermispora B]|uniref:Protein kinase domain-containing protein n=1 Tax=Ceriporiopsis subvermispora (strain B) TaxID=914234 RepID=M2REC9_CERS8|nr:hypothetical protein CERSUDRAFT_95090 [Gelatoporia subvermispora B]